MGSLLFMGNPYQHAPEVAIVRTDTCSGGGPPSAVMANGIWHTYR